MNTERFLWPVIIAAGLHGALLLSFSAKTLPPVDGPEVAPVLPDLPRIEMSDPPKVDPGEAGTGGVEPLLALADIPRPVEPTDVFTVPVTPHASPIARVKTLPDNPTSPFGPGDHDIALGRPSIPNVGSLDRIPRAIVQPSPTYPETLRHNGITGSVTVEFIVDTTGRVVSAEAVRCTHREFADPAVRAVLRWRFEPGSLNGRKVSFRVAVPIEFNADR